MDNKINPDWARDIPCRNITIHGFCKYEGKGCSFRHDAGKKTATINNTQVPTTDLATKTANLSFNDEILRPQSSTSSVPSSSSSVLDLKKKFNPASSSAFTPLGSLSTTPAIPPSKTSTNKFTGLSPKISSIPTFVPSSLSEPNENKDTAALTSKQFNLDSPVFQPSTSALAASPTISNPYLAQDQPPSATSLPPGLFGSSTQPSAPINPYASAVEPISSFNGIAHSQEFLYSQPAYPLQYHLYAPTPPPLLQVPLNKNEENSETLFISNKLRETLTKKNEATLKRLGQSNLPESVGVYYDLVPLDNSLEKSDRTYGYSSSIYKAFSNVNGRAFVLRRIENVKIPNDKSISAIIQWTRLKHSNISHVVDAFTTRSFGDNSLIVVYDYYPASRSLLEYHFNSSFGKPEPITPESLWTYASQIISGIAAAHSKKLAIRSLSLQKIIVTSRNRIRLSDIGVFDILNYDEHTDANTLKILQQEDLTKLGKLLLFLASVNVSASLKSLPEIKLIKHLDVEEEYKQILEYLLDNSIDKNISEVQRIIAPKLFRELDKAELSADYYEAQLTREVENARLVRLLAKLNFVIDRPEYEQNQRWTEIGDKYPIKLFHQFVFHQIDDNGHPSLDLSHVLRSLNKLDAGIDEKILLVSPDEQTCLIISYKEIKDLIEKSFRELTKDS